MVMYLGRMIEKAPAETLFANPLHPYTQALLSAIPVPRIHNRPQRVLLRGELASPINPEPVCRFISRCNRATTACNAGEPALREISPGHFAACHLAG
jgi:oligopeptide/dipeptide ABC transporter ATP-binding protein